MKCPYCGFNEDRVVDSRTSDEENVVRRRRECIQCLKRFTTYERVELPLMVVKKDGRREGYDRNKILRGIRAACEKRPVGMEQLEAVVDSIERALHSRMAEEVRTTEIGELVMEELKMLDHVAYVRFASVYRQFEDASDFKNIVDVLGHPS